MDDLQSRLRRIETGLQGLESRLDPAVRGEVQEIVGILLDLHGEGLRRMLERLPSKEGGGPAALEELAKDGVIGGLLLLHGLHPQDLETRVRGALDRVRPTLAGHGGNVEMLGVDERGVLRLRLEGSCHGCPSSEATLRTTIVDAVHEAAPDVTEILLDNAVPAAREVAS